jgi:hypothetical protein
MKMSQNDQRKRASLMAGMFYPLNSASDVNSFFIEDFFWHGGKSTLQCSRE